VEGVGVVGHNPAVVGSDVAGGGPGEVDVSVEKEEGGAWIFFQRVEGDLAVGGAVAFAGDGCGDGDGAVGAFASGGDVEGVEFLDEGAVLFGADQDVHGFGGGVDDGGWRDAYFGKDEGALYVAVGEGGGAVCRVEEAGVPERGVVRAVGVEGVDAVVLGGGEDYVALAEVGDGERGDVEGLGEDVAVDGEGVEFAEGAGVDVGGGEDFFVESGAGAGVVVLGGEDLGVRCWGDCDGEAEEEADAVVWHGRALGEMVAQTVDVGERFCFGLLVVGRSRWRR